MRKLFVILLMVPLFFACSEEEKKGTFLTGMADNLEEGHFVLRGPGGTRDTIFLNEDNSFEHSFEGMEKPGNYSILSKDDYFSMYIAPDMQLDVYFDMANFQESINFDGKGSDINNYKADKARDFDYLSNDVWTKLPDAFRAHLDSLLEAQQSLFNEQVRDNEEDAFWAQEEGEILYSWAQNLSSYPSSHRYYSDGEEVELTDEYNSYKEKLSLNSPQYLASSAYKSYIHLAVREAAAPKVKDQEGLNRSLINLQTGVELISDVDVLNDYLASVVTGRLSRAEVSELKDEIDFFKANCTSEEKKAEFDKQYDEWKSLGNGEPAYAFEGHDLEGNLVKFSDFKGKYVYVDVWATWCGPCIYEIPFLKTLEADYHDRNIVFLSYSIDEDKDAWLKFVPENELGGVQIIGNNGWKSQLCLDYKVRGVPTFMMFDPDGKIISVKMTRPSSQDTRDRFDSYTDL